MPETEAAEAEAPERRPFAAWLTEQRNGGLHGEVSDAFAELVQAVNEHEKTGKLTLTVTVTPNGDGSIFIGDDLKITEPKPDKPKALFFTDDRGNVTRRDPRQAELPLRDASASKQIREAS
jgi:hypothetical protein